MLELNARNVMNAASASAATATADHALPRNPARTLSPAAATIAAEPVVSSYSPIVLAGTVRLIEFTLIVVVGLGVYIGYVVPTEGFETYYLVAVIGIALMAMFAFQAADIYQVQAFRGYEKQYFRLASAWSVVFLITMGITFFAKAGEQFSRIWLGTFYRARPHHAPGFPADAVSPGAPLDAGRPARSPHRHHRRR